MNYNNEDIEYKQAIDVLKRLPQVKAPLHFEADLMRRINRGEVGQESFWDRLFTPAKLVPSAALGLIAVVLLFVVNTSSVEQDDPLSFKPKIREDITNTGISVDEQMKNRPGQNQSSASFVPASSISKSSLNFRQINLSPEQKQKLNQLKAKINRYFYQNKQEKTQK